MGQIRRWHVYPDAEALCQRAADAIVRVAAEAIGRSGAFRVVLAGGATPREMYRRLRHTASDWRRWHIYIGDERCVPVGHAERNDAMARTAWLAHVAVPDSQIHMMPAELGPDEGARRYARLIGDVERFDLVLLGVGEDGHTASLFPDHEARRSTQDVVPVRNSPKPPPERISLSAARLSRSAQVFFLVAGVSKRQAVASWIDGKSIPAADIIPAAGVDIFVERSALPDATPLRF